jgi:hypothetical protein
MYTELQGEPIYDLASLCVFNVLTDLIVVKDLNPRSLKNYWGNDVMCGIINKSLQELIDLELLKGTSPQMLEWNREVYEQVQVRGEQVTARRTFYPPSGQPYVVDMVHKPFRLRVPTGGETGETTVKTLTLVHGKKVNLNDEAMKEANRAAMLMNYTESSIMLLQADDTENAGDSENAAADRPALFANLRARQAYAVVGGAGGAGNITLTKVLDSFSFQHEAEREALQEKILKLKMHDTPISLEQETPAGINASLRACLHVHLNRHPYMSEQLGGRSCATYTAAKSPSRLRQINF